MHNDIDVIKKIISEIEYVEEFTNGMTYEDFMADEKTRRSVVMTFINMAEASKLLSEKFKDETNVPVKEMIALRNVAAHKYDGIRFEMVWNAVDKALPDLKKRLEEIMGS